MQVNDYTCISGCLVFQDVVQPPKAQNRKEFHDEHSSLPGKPRTGAHTAEILCQVEQVQESQKVGGLAVMRGLGV